MSMSAGEVIMRRIDAHGLGRHDRPPEAVGMVMEKATAFALAAEKAAVAAARGGDAAKIASAALRPYGARTRANVRQLRR